MDFRFKPFPKFSTNAIHIGSEPDQWGSADVVPHIALSTIFRQKEPGDFSTFDYSRCGNPTRSSLERALAATENATYALAYSSGTAALAAIVHLLKAGDELITMLDLYGGTITYLEQVAKANGIHLIFEDLSIAENILHVLSAKTQMIWIESPTNPAMKVVDIAAVVKLVKTYKKHILVVVDNTFTTPYFLRPLDLGADISHQSCTKFIAGHSDVVMGSAAVNDSKVYNDLKFMQINMGAVPSPFDCYLVLRSLKTLPVRMKEHMRNGLIVAEFLQQHPCVEKVNHPGLVSHPQHDLFKRQSLGYSGMMSFYIKGGKTELFTFFKNLKVFTLAASFGGCESIVSFPSVMTHAGIAVEMLEVAGITENLARLSVGLEDVEDLLGDLDQALRSTRQEKIITFNGFGKH